MRNKELNNGRFAMFASVGIILAELMARNGMDDLLGPPSTAQQYGQQQYVPKEYYAPPAVDPGKTVDLSGGGGGFATPQQHT
eukprot:g22153.t1